MNWRTSLLGFALLFAALTPLLPRASLPSSVNAADFPGWPSHLGGIPLVPMVPGPQDEFFSRDFPGKVARFSAGDQQIVVRWVNSATRRLHPARHCFAGAGYTLHPEPMSQDFDGALMSCFAARKPGESLRVCEALRNAAGRSWSDVSSWYWHAVTAPAGSSWWSFVRVSRESTGNEL